MGRIIAVEPYSRSRNILLANALGHANGEGQIYLTDRNSPGEATFRPKNKWASSHTEAITVRSLDSMMKELRISKIDIAKIDAEGAELEILEGGKELFRCCPPGVLYIECIDDHSRQYGRSSFDLVNWLIEKKYQVYGWLKIGWKNVEPKSGLNLNLMTLTA